MSLNLVQPKILQLVELGIESLFLFKRVGTTYLSIKIKNYLYQASRSSGAL